MKRELASLSAAAGLFLSGCGGSNEKENATGVEDSGVSAVDLPFDEDWRLLSIREVGESELRPFDQDSEASFYRFNFRIGELAVSCLVATDSDGDFPDNNYIDPRLCFIDGDPTHPFSNGNSEG